MGWTSYHREKGDESNSEHFAKKFDSHYEIITDGTVENVFYAAIRDNRTGEVFAFLALIQWTRGEYNFAYKDLEESSGPGDHKAPMKVLNALTPTTNEYALKWRAACRLHHEQRAFLRKQLKPGARIRLRHPRNFTDGTTLDTFTYTRPGGGSQGYLTHDNWRYQVPNWRDTSVVIINADGSETLTPVGAYHQAQTEQAREETQATPDKQQHNA